MSKTLARTSSSSGPRRSKSSVAYPPCQPRGHLEVARAAAARPASVRERRETPGAHRDHEVSPECRAGDVEHHVARTGLGVGQERDHLASSTGEKSRYHCPTPQRSPGTWCGARASSA